MPDTRLSKAIFYSQLSPGSRVYGHPVKRYKDSLKKSLQLCNINPATWETTAQDRLLWRHSCAMGISSFERQRISDLQLKRERRKAGVDITSQSYNCTICGRGCAAAIGLYSHMRTHKHWLFIRQLDGRFQQIQLWCQSLCIVASSFQYDTFMIGFCSDLMLLVLFYGRLAIVACIQTTAISWKESGSPTFARWVIDECPFLQPVAI